MLAVVEAGALSTEESSRAARLLAEPFCDEGLLEVLPFAASLSVAVMAAVTVEGSAGLPFRVAKYAAVSNLATSFSSCCLYCCAALEVYCKWTTMLAINWCCALHALGFMRYAKNVRQ